jgi:hypothetical protein
MAISAIVEIAIRVKIASFISLNMIFSTHAEIEAFSERN